MIKRGYNERRILVAVAHALTMPLDRLEEKYSEAEILDIYHAILDNKKIEWRNTKQLAFHKGIRPEQYEQSKANMYNYIMKHMGSK